MQHTDFFARIRAIKTEEYKELQAAVELHGGIYEWDLRNPEHPVIAVNLNGIIPAPADVRIYKVYIRKGMLKLCGEGRSAQDWKTDWRAAVPKRTANGSCWNWCGRE